MCVCVCLRVSECFNRPYRAYRQGRTRVGLTNQIMSVCVCYLRPSLTRALATEYQASGRQTAIGTKSGGRRREPRQGTKGSRCDACIWPLITLNCM